MHTQMAHNFKLFTSFCRDISLRITSGLPLRPESTVSIDCAFHSLDLYSQAGRFQLPPYGSIEFRRCNVDNFEDHADAESEAIAPASVQRVFGGAGARGGSVQAFHSTIRWFDAVRTVSLL